jgi:catechol 2,3-dioxygenase-like lactoylglutathione lyase family enzyme
MLSDARTEATVPVTRLGPAREFYEAVLGLRPVGEHGGRGADVTYECGDGTRLMLYEWGGPLTRSHTVAHFVVDDVPATVAELRGRGVRFDEYDLPELHLVDGVATIGDHRFAWFKDPDLNVIGIHD